ncbi:MAG: hypothetical protein MUE86_03770, partial [Thiobacillaceae bacterium]|nr:hypothetical protein [Thiobacillaceae bacterium]
MKNWQARKKAGHAPPFFTPQEACQAGFLAAAFFAGAAAFGAAAFFAGAAAFGAAAFFAGAAAF